MAGLNRFQYVGKDYTSIVDDCVSRIKEQYPDKWNDFYEDSSGMMLVELFAYVTDLLLFYLERQANETYLPTASERQNVINLCKLVGYTVSGASPAQAELRFALSRPHVRDVTIPAGTIVESQGGVAFETDSEVLIEAGSLSGTCYATEGETYTEAIGKSNGTAAQDFFLPRASVIKIKNISVGGIDWEAVDSVAEQNGEACVYMADMDAVGRARIVFGDGKNGRIPEKDAPISATYRIGGGAHGNVAPEILTVMREIATDELGDRVPISVTNLNAASGGVNPESIDRVKKWAPRYFEAQNRCVTQTDYETIAMTFQDPNAGRIAKARAIVRERSGEANVIRYYVLAYSDEAGMLAPAGSALKAALLGHIDKHKMFTDWVEIEDGRWRLIDFRGTIRVARGVSQTRILRDVKNALVRLMDAEIRSMGEHLHISDVYASIDNIEGVIHVEMETPVKTISAATDEILLLGNISFELNEGVLDGTNT